MRDTDIKKVVDKYQKTVKEKNQLVSIFLTTHKRPYYLSLAIDSILKQTYKNFCLVILDNMSCDETADTVLSIKDDRVFYIEREGTKESPNPDFAFEICKTKYFVIFHDDDIVLPDYLETMLNTMEKNPNITILSCGFETIDENGDTLSRQDNNHKLSCYVGSEYTISKIQRKLPFYVLYPTIVYKAEFFENRSKYADEKAGPSADDYMCFQIGRYGGTIAILNECLFKYRVHTNQDSSQNGWWMGLYLLNYMFKQDYYNELLDDYLKDLGDFLDTSMSRSMRAFVKGYISKKDIKKAYSLVPKKIKKANPKIHLKYLFFSTFPRTYLLIYRTLKKDSYRKIVG